MQRGLPRHRGPRRPLLRLGPGDGHVRHRRPGSTQGMEVHGAAGEREEGVQRARRAQRPAHGGARRRSTHGEPPERGSDAAASALRLPDPEAALRALHAGVRRRGVRLHASSEFVAVAEALCDELGPRADERVLLRGRLDAAHGRRAVHPHRRDHPAPARQHRPAGRRASSRCAGTRRSRARPTSRRSTTSCPGYLTMPHVGAYREPRPLHRGEQGAGRLVGQLRTLHRRACSRRGGASTRPPTTTSVSTTCRGSTRTTRSTSACSTCSTAASRASSSRARTRPSARRTRSCTGSRWRS